MKKALDNIIKNIGQQSIFLTQIAADVAALRAVVSALSPEASAALEEQTKIHRDKLQSQISAHQVILESMQKAVSKIEN